MPLTDYADTLERISKAIAARYAEEPAIFNIPGRSLACKLDPNYYLAVEPLFIDHLAQWAGIWPDKVRETLVRTGNLISCARGEERLHSLTVRVVWPGHMEPLPVRAAFVLTDLIDRSLVVYGGRDGCCPTLSDLKVVPEDREILEEFFTGKTAPGRWVYY